MASRCTRSLATCVAVCYFFVSVSAWGTPTPSVLLRQTHQQSKTKAMVNVGLSASLFFHPSIAFGETSGNTQGFPTTAETTETSTLGEFKKQFEEFQKGGGIKSFKTPDMDKINLDLSKLKMPDVPKMPEIPSTANLKMPDVPKMPEIPSTANLKMPDLPKLPMPDVSKPPAAPSTKPDSKPKDTTPDASTKVESKAKESKAKPAATQRGGFKVKDEVSVAAPFESANEDPKKLDKGLRGKVLDIDADGDALIDFKGAIGQQFVPKDQFDKLEKVAPAP